MCSGRHKNAWDKSLFEHGQRLTGGRKHDVDVEIGKPGCSCPLNSLQSIVAAVETAQRLE